MRPIILTLSRSGLVLLLLLAGVAHAGLYRWVDDTGKVHYSDVVPVAAVKQAHSELNEQGMTVKTFPAAPTEEEIAARQRRETLAKLRDAMDNQQQQQDDNLLANYADVAELDAVFNSKVAVLEKNTRSIQERRDSLADRLAAVKAQAGHVDDAKDREKLAGYIQEAEKTLANYDYALQENQTEMDRMHQHYEQDRERLNKLLSESPSSPHPDRSTAPVTVRAALDRQ